MPGFNQTGPMGQGPMTGRRMGRCSSPETTAQKQATPSPQNASNTQPGTFQGRGLGYGRGRGRGRGGQGSGIGRQNRFGGQS